MRASSSRTFLVTLLVLTGIVSAVGVLLALPAGKAPNPIHDTNTQKLNAPTPAPASNTADAERRGAIKELDDKIKALRETYKSQVDPLEAQVKSLREKFEADLKPLQDQRTQLVEEGQSPDLKSLNEQEAGQIADIDTREKADIDGVRKKYDDEKKQIRDSFAQKRHDLMAKK